MAKNRTKNMEFIWHETSRVYCEATIVWIFDIDSLSGRGSVGL